MATDFTRDITSPEAAAALRRLWGARIRKARGRRSLSRADLARAVQVSTTAVGMWERGETSPRPLLQAEIAAVLEVAPTDLFPLTLPTDREAARGP